MDLRVLNYNLDAFAVFDSYSSLIWTDRFNESGDFEIYTQMSSGILDIIKQGYYLQRRDTDHVMIIEKILINTDSEDGDYLTVTGRSLESLLDRRIVWGQKIIKGNLQNGIKALLLENVIAPSNSNRKIPSFTFVDSTDPAITSLTLEAQYTGDNLYDVIKKICSEKGIGFKITIDYMKRFAFELYAGVDRSYSQSSNSYVVFSPKFDNMVSSNYMESKSALKNVTLVGGEGEGSSRRYTAVGNVSGISRREIFTDARDISSDIYEDITSLFDFKKYPSQVFNNSSKTFVTDSRFNSAMVDVSAYAGRKIEISLPKYTNPSGAISNYAMILVNASKAYVSTLKVWDKYDATPDKGVLDTYQFTLPTNATHIYTSMYSQSAISSEVYYGDTNDFGCVTTKLSNDEYISLLRQRGKEQLSENMDVVSFEGQAETTLMYKYGTDFFDGDIVQIADAYGHEVKARILEVVTSNNDEGFTVYPTFSMITEEGV